MREDPLRFVKMFAVERHGRQRYGVLPYSHHLERVEMVLRRFGYQDHRHMLEAAWLHDVVEDTDTTIREVRELFGPHVARLVEAVTSEPGPNRKVRNALTYPKIRAAGVEAIALKLADRIANVENGGDAVDMYRKEHPEFLRSLGTGELVDMWTHLSLLFSEETDHHV